MADLAFVALMKSFETPQRMPAANHASSLLIVVSTKQPWAQTSRPRPLNGSTSSEVKSAISFNKL